MRLVNDIMSILMFRKTKQILYLDKILLSLRIRKIIATNLLPTPRSTPPLQNIIYGILEMWWLNSCLKPSRIRDPEVIHSILGGGATEMARNFFLLLNPNWISLLLSFIGTIYPLGTKQSKLFLLQDGPSNFRRMRPELSTSSPLQANILGSLTWPQENSWSLAQLNSFWRVCLFFIFWTFIVPPFLFFQAAFDSLMWTKSKCVNYLQLHFPLCPSTALNHSFSLSLSMHVREYRPHFAFILIQDKRCRKKPCRHSKDKRKLTFNCPA